MKYFGIAFIILGAAIFLKPIIQSYLTKKQCSVKISAVCSGYEPYINYLNLQMSCPTFCYTYKNQEYKTTLYTYQYTEKCEFKNGDSICLYLNPKNPRQIWMPKSFFHLLGTEILLPSAVFIIAGCWMASFF